MGKEFKIGDRIQLRFLNKATGTIIGIQPGLKINHVIIPAMKYTIEWDDGNVSSWLSERELKGVTQ